MDRTHADDQAGLPRTGFSGFGDTPDASASPGGLQFDALARTASVAQVRAAVRACDEIPRASADDVGLVVSELFTNAIRHAGLTSRDSIQVSVAVDDDVVTIEVQDHGPGIDPDAAALRTEPTKTGGYGLRIVNALSQAWGCAPGGRVWAQVGPVDALAHQPPGL